MSDTSLKANIPTLEVKLDNGETVVMYKYLTTGEFREVQKMMLKGGNFNAETGKMENLSPEIYMEAQDKTAGFLIKTINKEDEVKSYSQEWLSNLLIDDGNKIYDQVNKAIQSSQITPEVKKN
ncbi:MAG: hypothetical protein WC549_00605 [Actinomycetota bacterium]